MSVLGDPPPSLSTLSPSLSIPLSSKRPRDLARARSPTLASRVLPAFCCCYYCCRFLPLSAAAAAAAAAAALPLKRIKGEATKWITYISIAFGNRMHAASAYTGVNASSTSTP